MNETNTTLNSVALISSNKFGLGDDDLGEALMKAFITTVLDVAPQPEKIFFINSGVFLCSEGSAVIGQLQELANSGIEILCCGTCLDYYNLEKKLIVGKVTNMKHIAESLFGASSSVVL